MVRELVDIVSQPPADTGETDARSLLYIAKSPTPLFVGLLQRDVWREDAQIVHFLEQGWIEPRGVEGFVITDAGRAAVEQFRRKYNLD